jgi:hypothetical protein
MGEEDPAQQQAERRPKRSAVRADVGGTVAMKSRPNRMAKIVSPTPSVTVGSSTSDAARKA